MVKIGEIEKEGILEDVYWDNDKEYDQQTESAKTIYSKDIDPYVIEKDTGNNNFKKDEFNRPVSWSIKNTFATFNIKFTYRTQSYTYDIDKQIINVEQNG